MRRINWGIFAGFLLMLAAMFSYPLVFVRWPITRDVPWVNLLLIAAAGLLIYKGVRRAWKPGPWRIVGIISSTVLAGLSLFVAGTFIWSVFVVSRQMPASTNAPQAGQPAPAFTLTDIHNKPV